MQITVNGKPLVVSDSKKNLHTLLAEGGIRLNAPCGGNGRCGKCRVRIANAPEPTAAERAMLAAEELAQGIRLACHTRPSDGMAVTLEQQNDRAARIATEGNAVEYPLAPQVAVRTVTLPAPSLQDQRSDLVRLTEALGVAELTASPEALNALAAGLRAGSWTVTVALRGGTLLDVNPTRVLGVAVDIGTTTLAAYLVDLQTGEELAVASSLNPQKPWGDDVISRCDAAAGGALAALQAAVAGEVDALVGRLCGQAHAARHEVYHMTVAGNTVMLHLFAGVSPANIAQSPFVPVWTGALDLNAAAVGLTLHRMAQVSLLPAVAGYVGADTVAAMLATGMKEDGPATLMIDIGTNGEIALAAGSALYACSTAAGPAFEGAHISAGMGGVAGAINRVEVAGDTLRYDTIGNEPARGICGSGLLDMVACLLGAGAIDDTGRIDGDGAPQWLAAQDDKVALDRPAGIFLTGRDVREVQLAKGAIAAGVQVLLQQAGIEADAVQRVCLAGGFGSYMDRASACRIGLLPQVLEGRTAAVGNASGAGAKAALLSSAAMEEAKRLATAVRYVELSARRDFQDAFMDNMLFPA